MDRRRLINGLIASALSIAIALGIAAPAWAAGEPELMVYRSPTCRCCASWINHMKDAGFHVQDIVTGDMASIKAERGVPKAAASCHTAIAAGYIIEGHVPASDVQRLLSERPNLLGIAAPGMPVGSPGMEMGDRVDPFTVVSFTQSGETAAYAEHL
ncbi:MAG: DUF411 domain-containing protein [Nodosilinea sp.]